jgi:hypothetical protein
MLEITANEAQYFAAGTREAWKTSLARTSGSDLFSQLR